MNTLDFWSKTSQMIQSQAAILYLVIKHEGSSPGKTGFKMLITNESQIGTIGGGIMEEDLIQEALGILGHKDHKPRIVHKIHRKSADPKQQSGLICAGEQTMLQIRLTSLDIELIKKIVETHLSTTPLSLAISQNGITLEDGGWSDSQFDLQYEGDTWIYRELLKPVPTVHLFGGGHVGYAISQVLASLDFYVISYDDRPNLSQFKENPYVHKKVSGPFSELASAIEPGSHVYIIVTTYSYPTDFEVLKQVAKKNVKYIGLMGSKAKISRIFSELRQHGISETQINKIYAPIGLNIPNETAEEIAISVVAQLISIKNSQREQTQDTLN